MSMFDQQQGAPTVVIAMGGHAFIQPGEKGTPDEQSANARHICEQIMTLVERGYNLVITHGNGPQVGTLMRLNELAGAPVPPPPLDMLVAQTEGSLGYMLQRALLNELRIRGIERFVVTMVTQMVVDRQDPAFDKPTKPVGRFLTEAEAKQRRNDYGWVIKEDPQRGWRRVVPSPRPKKVIQRDMIREAAQASHIVVAAGGGGIPVVKSESGDHVGIEGVIDKDLTSAVLATDVEAELLIILTAVDRVFVNFGTPEQRALGAVTMSECERLIAEDHFPAGSMGPKVEAIHGFLKRGGRRGLITSADKLLAALDGAAGTHFVGRL